MSWLLGQLGDCCYRLNGGLDALHNSSMLDRLAFFFWSESYSFEDDQCRAMKPVWLRWLR